jgi:L-fuconolactonase
MIDTHFHIWHRADVPQAGILGAPFLQRDVTWDDFCAACDGLPVERCVEVQVNDFTDPAAEALFVSEIADQDARLGAYVGWAHLESADAAGDLEALLAFPLVRGVRRTLQIEADPGFALTDGYLRGARLLGEKGLLCELCVRHDQIESVPPLVRACPDTEFVLQHIGKPDLSRPPVAGWLRAVEELGRLPNLTCKLSVVVHSDSDPQLRVEAVAPFIGHLVDCLGWERLMFGSNWPVATAVVGYREWVDMLEAVLAHCGGDQDRLKAVLSENARRVYRLAST